MNRFRFLQLSDVHFGAAMTGSRLALPPEKRELRQQEFEALVRRLPQWVQDHQADAVLLPGDLWDHEALTPERLKAFRILYDALNAVPVPVLIAPGNHDYYSPRSFYHPDRLAEFGFAPWGQHIHIFTSSQWASISVPGWEGTVYATGRAFEDNTLNRPDADDNHRRPLRGGLPQPTPEAINLLLFHGARDDANRCDEKLTAPFSRQELLTTGYDYTAIGHYHTMDLFKTDTGEIRGAYSGCLFGRGLDETGDKVFLVGEIIKDGAAPAQVTLTPVQADTRAVRVTPPVTLTGLDTADEIYRALEATLQATAQPQDMVICPLQGQLSPGIVSQWSTLTQRLETTWFHVQVDTRNVQDAYDLESLRREDGSLEGRFIQAIESRLGQSDDDTDALLREALYLGLDALTGHGVRTP